MSASLAARLLDVEERISWIREKLSRTMTDANIRSIRDRADWLIEDAKEVKREALSLGAVTL